jgi:hypothetical protein
MSEWSVAAAFVALAFVLFVQRKLGPRMAGLFVCLPLTAGPFALMLYLNEGAGAARSALLGGIEAIAGAAVAFTVFGLLRRRSLALSVPMAASAFLAMVVIAEHIQPTHLLSALIAVGVIVLCALIAHRVLHETITTNAQRDAHPLLRYAAPFVLLAAVLALSQQLPAHWCGLIAAAPILSFSVLISMRACDGSAYDITKFVRGAFEGLAAKLAFFVAAIAILDFEHNPALAFAVGACIAFSLSAVLWWRLGVRVRIAAAR